MSSDLQIRRLNSRISSVNSILEGRINDINIEHDGFTLPEEIARATAADAENMAAILVEETRAKSVEFLTNSNLEAAKLSISNEITRANTAETTLDVRITNGGQLLSTNISQETSRAMTAENSIQSTQGTHASDIASLRDEMDQLLMDSIVYAFQVTSNLNTNQLMQGGSIQGRSEFRGVPNFQKLSQNVKQRDRKSVV